jgi:hypothetical protein
MCNSIVLSNTESPFYDRLLPPTLMLRVSVTGIFPTLGREV